MQLENVCEKKVYGSRVHPDDQRRDERVAAEQVAVQVRLGELGVHDLLGNEADPVRIVQQALVDRAGTASARTPRRRVWARRA